MPPVSSIAFCTPAMRRCVFESTLLPVMWTRLPSPPIASIAALAAWYAAASVSVDRQKSARFSSPAGQEAIDPTARPASLSFLKVVLMSVGETPKMPNAL